MDITLDCPTVHIGFEIWDVFLCQLCFCLSTLQVQMKDFRFSYKFKMACKEDVLKLCPNIKKKWVHKSCSCFFRLWNVLHELCLDFVIQFWWWFSCYITSFHGGLNHHGLSVCLLFWHCCTLSRSHKFILLNHIFLSSASVSLSPSSCVISLFFHLRADVVICLSTTVRNDTLQDVKDQRVSLKCRKQLRVEELEMVNSLYSS